ncbi:MAG: alternative ribosome rescue aminoacyl-tRNA hydrolase ArfB [Planctomycetia bacterium]|nr:alternative ribosome rescue aminoacyl-tRNA hydrolase ArfB [Planctomycetia bacterium]
MLEINQDFSIPLSEIEFTYARSSGPGGQNVNKVSSKAILRWDLVHCPNLTPEAIARFGELFPSYLTKEGEVVIMSQESRDAPKNRINCLEKLRSMLIAALKKKKPRIPTKPTKGSIRRRLEDKTRNAEKKERRKKVED